MDHIYLSLSLVTKRRTSRRKSPTRHFQPPLPCG